MALTSLQQFSFDWHSHVKEGSFQKTHYITGLLEIRNGCVKKCKDWWVWVMIADHTEYTEPQYIVTDTDIV